MRTKEKILNTLLNQRGIESESEIMEFLSDRPQKTYDPFLLHGMKEGVDLLLSEIKKGKRICIYGDYDADGVTSVCILMKVLLLLTDNIFYYVPSRFTEGYGLNKNAIDKVKEKGADLIITVDCGCVSYEEVEYAKSIGLTVIVTDHHTIDSVIADCIVINPKHPENEYPFTDLAGCGVAYKVLQAIQRREKLPRSILNDVLDLVAIGTIGDIVSLQDENRTLVKYGLRRINQCRSMPLQALSEAASLHSIDSGTVAFGIVPRINAAGRMHSACDAIDLFLSSDPARIQAGVELLMDYNSRRKSLQDEAFERCKLRVTEVPPFIMLKMENIHEGIAGIVAGKLKDEYNRPVVLATPSEDGCLKGTGRSIESINLFDVLNQSKELFERFGGHKGACGFLIKEENFETLKSNTLDYVSQLASDNDQLFDIETEYDLVLSPGELSIELGKALQKLEPCGAGNPFPTFKLQNVLIQKPYYMGEKKNHVRFTAYGDGAYVNCVLFQRAADYEELLTAGKPVDLIGNVNYQIYRGSEKIQFKVEAMKQCK